MWKNKLGDVIQMLDAKRKSVLSSLSSDKDRTITDGIENTTYEFPHLLRDISDPDVTIEPCWECDQEYGGILTIEGEPAIHCTTDSERRNDREEIRRRLAMDYDASDFTSEKINQNRHSYSSFDKLKGSNNLQICFVNEMFKDKDLQKGDSIKRSDCQRKLPDSVPMSKRFSLPITSSAVIVNEKGSSLLQNNNNRRETVIKRPKSKFIFNRPHSWGSWKTEQKFNPEDFLTAHVKLQTEARAALAQAKDMARMQMELERQKKKKSPIADIVGLPFPDGKFLLSRNALVDLNVAQLQVIVNDLHSQIENLNEDLVKILLERDDLHMEQDSMLVDIEDLTRYLGLKGSSCSSLSTSS